MKKFTLFLAVLAFASFSFGQQKIAGSAHDFVTGTGNIAFNTMASNKMCGPCHTPHNAPQSASGPLWSHDLSVAAFIPYTSPFNTLDGVIGAPAGVSLYCLSCHDGVTNLNAHTNGANNVAMGAIPARVGSDLSNDHPISITFTDATAATDGELFAPTTTVALGGFIDTKMLFAGKVECGSCHDVHNNVPAGVTKMLHMSNVNSELCLTCHNK